VERFAAAAPAAAGRLIGVLADDDVRQQARSRQPFVDGHGRLGRRHDHRTGPRQGDAFRGQQRFAEHPSGRARRRGRRIGRGRFPRSLLPRCCFPRRRVIGGLKGGLGSAGRAQVFVDQVLPHEVARRLPVELFADVGTDVDAHLATDTDALGFAQFVMQRAARQETGSGRGAAVLMPISTVTVNMGKMRGFGRKTAEFCQNGGSLRKP